MRYCEWKRGCWQSAAGGEKFCYYHEKLTQGLIAAPQKKSRSVISPAQVVSDEQMAIAKVLVAMGASRDAVRRAITREGRRKGAGVR